MPRHPDPVIVEVPIGAALVRRLDAALLSWLEQEERTTAGRNRMRTIRALTKTAVRPDIA